MTQATQTLVAFLSEPVEGQPCEIVTGGAQSVTAPATSVRTHPQHPGWFWVATQYGLSYVGQVLALSSPGQTGPTPPLPDDCLPGDMSPVNRWALPVRDGQALNWGAFLLPLWWSLANRVWLGIFSIIPAVNLAMSFVLLVKGNQWAWENRRFNSLAEFRMVQRRWTTAAYWVTVLLIAFGIFLGLGLSATNR
jgi:hypothetical protein